jgi:hypothetical protein
MLGRSLKVVSILTLLLAVFLGRPNATGLVLFQFLLCGCASLVVFQAVSSSRYVWTAPFILIAVLFNPIVPVPFSSSGAWLAIDLTALVLFVASLALLKTAPRLAMVSIADPGPPHQSP